MTARTSIALWAGYLFALGAVLIFAPNILLSVFGIPETSEVWIRVAGMLLWILVYFYTMAVREDVEALYRWSVPVRLMVPVFFAGFVAAGLAPPVILLFSAIDAAGAVLTWVSLRAARG